MSEVKNLKIHILFEHGNDLIPHGCSYIRLLLPFGHPEIKNYFSISSGTELGGSDFDIVIVERLWRDDLTLHMAEELVNKIRKNKNKLIYAIDDNLLDLQIIRKNGRWPSLEQKNIIRYFAREADGIIVSTNKLKDRFSHLNRNIIVVENALDERLFGPREVNQKQKQNRIVIGYMGTHSHDSDLMMVILALRQILNKYKQQVKLELIGILSDNSVLQLFDGLPAKVLDTKGNHEYPKFIKWMRANAVWDLAIAPLEDTPFTCCKSDLKFLDYSALGIPGIVR